MSTQRVEDRLERALAGAVVTVIGLLLFGVPAYDIYDDVTALSWNPAATLLENATFILLAGVLVGGGVWLSRVDWEARYVRTVAGRTAGGTAAVLVLVAFVVVVQRTVMGSLKPYVIAMDAVLIGATTSFALGVYTARAQRQAEELTEATRLNERLSALHEYTGELEGVDDREAAYAVVAAAVDGLLDERDVRVTVDGDRVIDDVEASTAGEPALSASVGEHGSVTVFGDAVATHERRTVELLAVHLANALDRLDRREAIRKQRERLEFVNRTVRHNLLNDVNVVASRLELMRPRADDRDHHETVVDRVDGMGSFIGTMRKYTNTIAGESADSKPVPLRDALEEQVESVRAGYPAATVELEAVPEVSVLADELLGPVFENPLTNAIEHHDGDEPTVAVSASVDGASGVARVRFADDGPGIADDRKRRVFERGESAGMTAGTGFGLYLVKDVVESYGGSVTIRDNEPRGTVVELELPLADES